MFKLRNRIRLIEEDSGGLRNKSTQARVACAVFPPHGLARLMRALEPDGALEFKTRQAAPIAYPAFVPSATEAVARVDPAELSRFEGEGGLEAPEPGS